MLLCTVYALFSIQIDINYHTKHGWAHNCKVYCRKKESAPLLRSIKEMIDSRMGYDWRSLNGVLEIMPQGFRTQRLKEIQGFVPLHKTR